MIAVPTLHPAYLLKTADGEKGEARFKNTVIADFKRAIAYLNRKPDWEESVIWERDHAGRLVNVFPTLDEVAAFFRAVQGTTCSVDIETTGEEPLYCQILCVGIASENGRAICIPFLKQGGAPYWAPGDLENVKGMLAWFLADGAATPKVFHNGPFDTSVLHSHGYRIPPGWLDTMAAHHVLDGEMPQGLDFVASTRLEVPYWKDAVKGDVRWIDMDEERLRTYNLRDCLVTIRAWAKLLPEVTRLGLLQLYGEELAASEIMTRATIRGVMVDIQRRDDLGTQLRAKRDAALLELRAIAKNDAFNPGSPIQLRKVLFEQLGFPIVARTKKGAPSSDKKAMVLLALHADAAHPEQMAFLNGLVRWRKNSKMLGTWVEGLHVLGDCRIHASWKMLTVTGRLASSPNMQNFNSAIKKIFCSGPGQKFVSIDLSQAELRVIAYLANDDVLLQAYRDDLNVHTLNATLLFQVRNPGTAENPVDSNAKTEAFLEEACPRLLGQAYADFPVVPKARWKNVRRLAKGFVFASNYGATPETIFETLRAARDPDTDEPMFPDLQLGTIEALKITWETLHPAIPRWWAAIEESTRKAGCYRSPYSGRIRWFRGGFKRNEILNTPIQEMVAARMNKALIEIDKLLVQHTGGEAVITMQVHDAITIEAPERWVEVSGQILSHVLNQPFMVPGLGVISLPADAPTVGTYLNEV